MALDLYSETQEWHTLVQIALGGGLYKRIADRHLPMSDATLWDGRLLDISPLRQELSSILEPQFVTPELRLVIEDRDGEILALLTAYKNFAGLQIIVKVGQGKDISNYEVRFTGQVRFPGGVEWNGETVTLDLDNSMEADAQVLPYNKVFPGDYPDADPVDLYKPIPEILGDFRSTAGAGETVPGLRVDTTVGIGGRFCFGEYAQEVDRVQLNGADLDPVDYTVTSLEPCYVTLNVAFATGDVVTANVLGRASALLGRDNPADWLYTLRTNADLLGIDPARVDTDTYERASNNYSTRDKCRRWIGAEISSNTLVAELCSDGFMDEIIDEDGQYAAFFRLTSTPEEMPIFRAVDIAERGGSKDFVVRVDPETTYVNQLVYDYRLKTDGTFAASGQIDDTDAQTEVGQIQRRRIQFKWLYRSTGASDRGHREIRVFSEEVEIPELTLKARGLTLRPTDQFFLIYSKYQITPTQGTPMMVRAASPNYKAMKAPVTVWNLDNLTAKRYQADGAAAFLDADPYAQSFGGFYQNGDTGEQTYF